MDHNSLQRLPRRAAGPPALRTGDSKNSRSMPDMGLPPPATDNDDDGDSLMNPVPNPSLPPASPQSVDTPAWAPPRRLRRVVSSPDNVRPDITWRVALATDPSADDSTILPKPKPDIDPSMLMMRGLDKSVFDAEGLQRWKTRTETPKETPPRGKRKRSRETAVSCVRCGTDDTPKWRPGPDGQRTLCNVCGLLFARRERMKYLNGDDGWG
ncbi:hypothetical protein F5X68DRAFT_261936 [Plectosphaerella plurivora]|uniref:GATA-type domain-containing protein n=1 Tax=Plectosphaerella plurivora TaxID=936078 RepID=A0A9P9ABQ1_9PEZI|nr:hypothetical protein F5X68DRAFT_261936 [Plectosphaerella plurivora]